MKKKRPENPSLRPIGARALTSAGDTLRPLLPGARVLELFAGQGRFGLMALEEGAAWVSFVEKDLRTAQALRKSLPPDALARVFIDDAMVWCKPDGEPLFDIVFADPPFPLWEAGFDRALAACVKTKLAPESIFLVKGPTRMLPSGPFPGLSFWKHSKFGESTLSYFRRATEDE
ncbi:RsmD family RNA methyltransferase [bacterium]|nr:RsmD family RNA methyltransferase [bacterium]